MNIDKRKEVFVQTLEQFSFSKLIIRKVIKVFFLPHLQHQGFNMFLKFCNLLTRLSWINNWRVVNLHWFFFQLDFFLLGKRQAGPTRVALAIVIAKCRGVLGNIGKLIYYMVIWNVAVLSARQKSFDLSLQLDFFELEVFN